MFLTRKPLQQQADAGGGSPAPSKTPPATPPAPQGAPAPQAQAPQQPAQAAQPPETPKPPAAPAKPADLAIKLPEGRKGNQKFIDGYLARAKELGYTQEQAQGMADYFFTAETTEAKGWESALKAHSEKNDATLKADPEWGGAKYDATVKAADSSLKQFFSEGFTKSMQDLGMHNDPDFRKGLALIRSLIAEDTVADKGKSAPVVDNSRAAQLKKMFPNSPQMFDQDAPIVQAGTPPA
jgi:hypothetical protein